ncbi:hypothetical protein DQ04_07861030 [Trypanosoma grayi]|uniref:hypothetical protein n=1 Tax=Trypanosoma grayi TaxID=71804 RepID=UPI0004F41318|nr:hypothetical protein DQ04_07861030 [Trypanosoma grayi]KEG08161.1 hypothetical protein DQ04_07861030 [Trypanosoma grayi]
MTLVASCNALYFPDPPMDNIITLSWQRQEGAVLAACSCVIFKVKSSSPKSFHVLPRYGALLLTDASGNPCTPCSAQITFGLRAAATDAVSEAATTTMRRLPHSAAGSHPHQERFAIEYAILAAARPTYERIVQAVAGGERLTEVVRSVWELVASGAQRSVRGSPISLKAHMEGVTMDSSKAGRHGVVVVPPTAHLVWTTLQTRLMSRASPASAMESGSSPSTRHLSERNRGATAAGELRALSLGIEALRHDAPTSTSNATIPTNTGINSTGTPMKGMPGGAGANPAAARAAYDTGDNGIPTPADGEAADIVMRITPMKGGRAAVSPFSVLSDGKNGIPLVVVLVAMFGTYLITVLLLRGGSVSASGNRSDIGIHTNDGA